MLTVRSPPTPSKISTNESNDIRHDCVPIGQAIELIRPSCVPSRCCTRGIVPGTCETLDPRETPNLNTSPSPLEDRKTLSPKKMPNNQPLLSSLSSIDTSPHDVFKSTCGPRIQPCVQYRTPFISRVPSKLPPELLLVSASGRSFVTPVSNVGSEPAVSQNPFLSSKFHERKSDLLNKRGAYFKPADTHKPCAPILNCIPYSTSVAPCRPSASRYHLVPCSISGPCQPSFEFYNSPPKHDQLSAPCSASSQQFLPCRPCVPLCQPEIPYITPCDSSKQLFSLSEPLCNLCTPCGINSDTCTPCCGPCYPSPFPNVPCRPCLESFAPSCELVCCTPTQYSSNSRMLPGCVPICDQCVPCNVPYSRPSGMNGSCCVLNPENCSLRNNSLPFCCAGNFINLPDLSPLPLTSSVPLKEVNDTK